MEINALLSASRALTERTAAAFHPDLQPAAFHLARWLYAYGPANPSTLAAAVAMDRSSTSSLIGRMKALGLVQSAPDPADRRAVKISLTTAGTERVVEALDLRGTSFFARTKDWAIKTSSCSPHCSTPSIPRATQNRSRPLQRHQTTL